MKCPRCGAEMTLDGHRKIDLYMCYECGYIEGRNMGDEKLAPKTSNYIRMRSMNFNETASFIATGLGVKEAKVFDWLSKEN